MMFSDGPEAEPLLNESPVSISDTVRAFIPLPFIAFGGPQAHVALMFDRFVTRKRWLSARLFTELLAISNALPGPASTQLAFTLALVRAGPLAAILSFLIWSIPGAIVVGVIGYSIGRFGSESIPKIVLQVENGLSCVALALVAIAALKLGGKILIDNHRRLIATGSACALILFPAQIWLIPLLLALGGVISFAFDRYDRQPSTAEPEPTCEDHVSLSYSRRSGAILVIVTILAVVVCAVIRNLGEMNIYLRLWATFFLVGAIIFGGGPVVIPMLYSYVVTVGWMSSAEFLLGLAVINCMPGPNFNFAAFCGALIVRQSPLSSAIGAFLGWMGIFLPGLALKAGILPLWSVHRKMRPVEVIFQGFNSVAVGFMFAAVYILWEEAVVGSPYGTSLGAYPGLVAITAISFVMLEYVKVPVPIVLGLAGFGSLVRS